jgi:hypothetical protein
MNVTDGLGLVTVLATAAAEFMPREPIVQPQWSRELMINYWRVKETRS